MSYQCWRRLGFQQQRDGQREPKTGKPWIRRATFSLALTITVMVIGRLSGAEADRAGSEFFERKIRPVLAEHCYECHSAQAAEIQGNLRLDTPSASRRGGDSGPAVVPGNVEASLLVAAIRYEGLEMPPKGRLPDQVIADFERWIKMGAPDPRREQSIRQAGKEMDFAAARRHWSFRPLVRPELPKVRHASWPSTAVDYFTLAQLEQKGLSPSRPADKRVLIRRVYFDLIGLPPTYEETESFVCDASPDALERLVDKLLASPHYGERWGRHWLDVARYADTKDLVLLFGKDRIRPYAYTYRDYVVRAFNEDLPYDQFIQQQIAADQIRPKVAAWQLAAMGFLTLGRLYDNNPHDIYDDQIDTVTRGLLALTVACARCHDHKYDAVPTEDYYSLYGIFAASEIPIELPLIADPSRTPGGVEFEKKAEPKRAALREFIDTQYRQINETARQRVADYLHKVATEKPDLTENAIFYLSLSPDDLKPQLVSAWRRYLTRRSEPDDPVFGPWHDLMQLSAERFAEQAADVVHRWQAVPSGVAPGQLNPMVKRALATSSLAGTADVAALYGNLLRTLYEQYEQAPQTTPGPAEGQLLEILTARDGPFFFPKSHAFLYMARVERSEYSKQLLELDKLAVHDQGAPPRARVLTDSAQFRQARVLVRGNPRQPGKPVPRQFLRILSGDDRQPFARGSGRMELALAITDADNPLTSRVMANRVWMHHFGQPLVSTPSDFGVRSDPPSHPQLLDYLAWSFQTSGWSLKALHRLIVLSATYQQASWDRPACQQIDSDNRLLWRANRRRLDLEAMRDALLCVSGRLDRTVGGRPVDVAEDPQNRRRTIYGLVDRQDLPDLYRVFDFANPDQSAAQRPLTTVPQQALFGMNSPFMIQQARDLAGRIESFSLSTPEDRIKALYRTALGRLPEQAEIESGLRFIQAARAVTPSPAASQLGPWQQYAQVLLMTNELLFVD